MVVLVGKMTKLVPYIISADKTYEAVIQFGVETDTLDITGKTLNTKTIPLNLDIKQVDFGYKTVDFRYKKSYYIY